MIPKPRLPDLLRKTPSQDSDLARCWTTLMPALRSYELDDPVIIGVLKARKAFSTQSNTLLIADRMGQRVILRQYHPGIPQEEIVFEHSILLHLAAKGFPVAAPIAASMGQTFLSANGSFIAVFPCVQGINYRDYIFSPHRKRTYVNEGGRTLGLYHRHMERFVPRGMKRHPTLRETLEGLNAALRDIRTVPRLRRGAISAVRKLVSFIDLFSSRLSDVETRLQQLPSLIAHWDFGPHNLLYRDDRVVAVLDFIDAHEAARAHDVIYAVSEFASTFWDRVAEEHTAAFLEGYQMMTPLEEVEMCSMPLVYQVKRLLELPEHVRASYSPSGDGWFPTRMLRRFLDELQWFQGHGDFVVDRLLRASRVARRSSCRSRDLVG